MTKNSPSRRGFGVYLGGLRDARRETQNAFAKRLKVSRSVIANTETGTPPSASLVNALIAAFPAEEEAIRSLTAHHRPDSRRHEKGVESRVERLDRELAGIPATEARWEYEIARREGLDPYEDFQFLARLARLHGEIGRNDPTEENVAWWCARLGSAIRRGHALPEAAPEVINLLDEYYGVVYSYPEYLPRSNANLSHNLDADIARHPNASRLWLRKATILWENATYAEAYASLCIALGLSNSKLSIRILRGQVLAEWGRHHEAISELQLCLQSGELTSSETASARAACGFSLFCIGEYEAAWQQLSQLKPARVSYGHGLALYWSARCNYDRPDCRDAAVEDFKKALRASHPRINKSQRDIAESYIRGEVPPLPPSGLAWDRPRRYNID